MSVLPEDFFLTHELSFRKACKHKGQLSDDKSLPNFSCKAVGDVLIEIMQMYRELSLNGIMRLYPLRWRYRGPSKSFSLHR